MGTRWKTRKKGASPSTKARKRECVLTPKAHNSHLTQYIVSMTNLLCSGYLAAAAKSLQSCPTMCDPTNGSPPGFPVPGILQARTLEWGAISFSNAGKWKVKVKSLKSCLTLSDAMDCSLPLALLKNFLCNFWQIYLFVIIITVSILSTVYRQCAW